MKYLLSGLSLFWVLGLQAQLPDGSFDDFASATYDIYSRSGGMFNPATCQIDGGELQLSGMGQGDDRPVGWRITDDFLGNAMPFYGTSSEDAQSGTALRLRGDGAFGFGIAGIFDIENLVQEVVPVAYPAEALPLTISGFYKHTSGTPRILTAGSCTNGGMLAQDSIFTGGFAIYAQFYDESGVLIAEVDTVLADVDTYTAFSAPVRILDADATAATYLVVLSSCPEFLSPNPIYIVGSESFVDEVSFNFTTNTEDLTTADAPQLFPNPAHDQLWIETEHQEPQYFEVYNATGQRIHTGLTNQSPLDISQWPAATYWLRAEGEVRAFVKQ